LLIGVIQITKWITVQLIIPQDNRIGTLMKGARKPRPCY